MISKVAIDMFQIISVMFMLFLVLQSIYFIIEAKRKPPEKIFVKTNMEQDFKFLYTILDEYTLFICDAHFIASSDGSSIINGKEFEKVAEILCTEVYSTLSDEYVDLLKLYADKFEEYLYQECYTRVKTYVREMNRYAIGKTIQKDRRV